LLTRRARLRDYKHSRSVGIINKVAKQSQIDDLNILDYLPGFQTLVTSKSQGHDKI
jgi:hypothetical protein